MDGEKGESQRPFLRRRLQTAHNWEEDLAENYQEPENRGWRLVAELEARQEADSFGDSQDPRIGLKRDTSPELGNEASARASPGPQGEWQMVTSKKRLSLYAEVLLAG